LPGAGCGSPLDYYFAHYNPTSPCLAVPPPPAPTASSCALSHSVKLRIAGAKRLRSATILLNGKRTLVVRGKALRKPVVLRGLRDKTARVQVVVRTRAGKTVRRRAKTYKLC